MTDFTNTTEAPVQFTRRNLFKGGSINWLFWEPSPIG